MQNNSRLFFSQSLLFGLNTSNCWKIVVKTSVSSHNSKERDKISGKKKYDSHTEIQPSRRTTL